MKNWSALEHHADAFQLRQAQRPIASGNANALSTFYTDARHAQQHFVAARIYVHREQMQIVNGPSCIWGPSKD